MSDRISEKKEVFMRKVWVSLLILSGVLIAQTKPGNMMEVPLGVNFPGDKPVVDLGIFTAGKIESNGIADRYNGVFPGSFGFLIGGGIGSFQGSLGYAADYGILFNLKYTLLREQGNLPSITLGIDNAFIKDSKIQSEGTPSDTVASGVSRIPLYLGLTRHISDFLTITGGLGLGKFAWNYTEIAALGGFWGVELRPFNALGIYWEGFMPSKKRNIGIGIRFMPGLEAVFNVKYADYTFSYFKADYFEAGIRYERLFARRKRGVKKKVEIIVFGKIYDSETGLPIGFGEAYIKETGDTTRIRRDGSFVFNLVPGRYTIVVEAKPKYTPREKIIDLSGDMPRINFGLRLKQSSAYKELLIHIKNAKEKLRRNLLKDAYNEIVLARAIDSTDKEVKRVYTQILARVDRVVKQYRIRARQSEKLGRYKTALKYWQAIKDVYPNDQEADVAIKRIGERLKSIEAQRRARQAAERQRQRKTPTKRETSKPKVDIKALMTRGKTLFYQGNYHEAKTFFERVLSIDPKNTEARYYLSKTNYYIKALGGGR